MKNMRTLLIAVLVIACMFGCIASAEMVQSPAKPSAIVTMVIPAVVPEDAEPFIVETVETELWSETAVQVFEEITETLADPEVLPVSLFTVEEMTAAAPLLPEEFDTDTLTIAEYIPLNIYNYVPEIGEALVQFSLPGEYTEEDVLIAMYKSFADGETSWTPLEVRFPVPEEAAAEGAEAPTAEPTATAEPAATAETDPAAEVTSNIEVVFTQEILEKLQANEGALLILRG